MNSKRNSKIRKFEKEKEIKRKRREEETLAALKLGGDLGLGGLGRRHERRRKGLGFGRQSKQLPHYWHVSDLRGIISIHHQSQFLLLILCHPLEGWLQDVKELLLSAELHEGLEVDDHLAVELEKVFILEVVLEELDLLAAMRGLVPCDLVLEVGILVTLLSVD